MAIYDAIEYARENGSFQNFLSSAFPGTMLYFTMKKVYYCSDCDTIWLDDLNCFNCGTTLEKGDDG